MNTIKVIEVLAESDSSWKDAAQVAVSAISGSIHNLRSLHVSELEAVVEGDKIALYRIDAKVSFLVDH